MDDLSYLDQYVYQNYRAYEWSMAAKLDSLRTPKFRTGDYVKDRQNLSPFPISGIIKKVYFNDKEILYVVKYSKQNIRIRFENEIEIASEVVITMK